MIFPFQKEIKSNSDKTIEDFILKSLKVQFSCGILSCVIFSVGNFRVGCNHQTDTLLYVHAFSTYFMTAIATIWSHMGFLVNSASIVFGHNFRIIVNVYVSIRHDIVAIWIFRWTANVIRVFCQLIHKINSKLISL